MKKHERICKKCKGIIDLKEHSYYKSNYNINRQLYLCSKNCLEWYIKDHYKITVEKIINNVIDNDFTFINIIK